MPGRPRKNPTATKPVALPFGTRNQVNALTAANLARPSKTLRVTIMLNGGICFIPLPFDPKAVFGTVRAPVTVTLNGYTYRSTIAAMGGPPCIPLRKSHREAAGLLGGETLDVTIELDTEPRRVEPPGDLARALKATAGAWDGWLRLSYTHQREHVEGIENAKRPETRRRRIDDAVRMLQELPR
jgi:hypothetical protein